MNAFGPYFGTDDEVNERVTEGAKLRFCPTKCQFLTITEQEQSFEKKHISHRCLRYPHNKLYHGVYHPEIIAIKGCKYSIKIKGESKCKKEKKPVKW